MTVMTRCQHVRQLLGVYVLGAIGPAERAEVDAHLASCPGCRQELAGLAGLPALLGRVPASEAGRIAGSDENERLAPGQDIHQADGAGDTLSPLLARMAQRRRVNRWRNLTAAAAAVIIGAGAVIGLVSTTGPPGLLRPGALHWETAAATNTSTHASADVRYAGTPSGTALRVSVEGIPAGTTCEFWVLGSHGREWAASSWTVPHGWRSPWYGAMSAAPVGAVRGFQITAGHTLLVAAQT